MANDGLVFIFLKKFVGAAKGYLINIFVDFFFGHADAAVTDSDGTFIFVYVDMNGKVT